MGGSLIWLSSLILDVFRRWVQDPVIKKAKFYDWKCLFTWLWGFLKNEWKIWICFLFRGEKSIYKILGSDLWCSKTQGSGLNTNSGLWSNPRWMNCGCKQFCWFHDVLLLTLFNVTKENAKPLCRETHFLLQRVFTVAVLILFICHSGWDQIICWRPESSLAAQWCLWGLMVFPIFRNDLCACWCYSS